jgi:hypothetical protein
MNSRHMIKIPYEVEFTDLLNTDVDMEHQLCDLNTEILEYNDESFKLSLKAKIKYFNMFSDSHNIKFNQTLEINKVVNIDYVNLLEEYGVDMNVTEKDITNITTQILANDSDISQAEAEKIILEETNDVIKYDGLDFELLFEVRV